MCSYPICAGSANWKATSYCRDISVKTRSALEVKRRSGDFVGAFTIYGYVKVGDKHKSLEVDEYAANVVRDIFRKRLEGFSASHIADELNRLGILSPLAYKRNHGMPHAKGGYTDRKDCKWSATTIIRILQDETYTGTLVQGKQTTPHFKLKEREDKPSSEYFELKADYEYAINALSGEIEVFEKSMDSLDNQLARYRAMEKDAKTLAQDHVLTAELIERLIERIEIDHERNIHVTFRFKNEFQGKAVELCATM